MNILNIHGYKGTPHNAAYNVIFDLEEPVISPEIDYDNEKPEEILRRLTDLCISEKIESLVGTGFGGFFALALAIKLEKPVILVSPCLQPEIILPKLGYEGDLSQLKKTASIFDDINIGSGGICCIEGDHDKYIEDHWYGYKLLGYLNVTTVKGGGHSGATLHLDYYFPYMLKQHYIYNLNKRMNYNPRIAFRLKGDCFCSLSGLWEDPYEKEFTVPAGIRSIGNSAFHQFIYLEKITLPEGLQEIGDFAFDRCASLSVINIPSSVKKIGKGAFRNCWRLHRGSIKFPKNAEICGDPFETPQSEWEELDYILYDQRDNPLLYG